MGMAQNRFDVKPLRGKFSGCTPAGEWAAPTGSYGAPHSPRVKRTKDKAGIGPDTTASVPRLRRGWSGELTYVAIDEFLPAPP